MQENLKKFNLEGEDDFMGEKSLDIESSYMLDEADTKIDMNYNLNNNSN